MNWINIRLDHFNELEKMFVNWVEKIGVNGEYFKSIKCLNRYITEGWDAYVGSILSRDYWIMSTERGG